MRARTPALLAALLATAAACGPRDLPELPPAPQVAEPEPDEVESVVFFIGDTGKTRLLYHPVLQALQRDVEAWSGALGREGAVAVVVMGDIVYPDGLHDAETPEYPRDSTHVAAQAALVGGPAARRVARQYFVAGNHDWGREEDWEGRDRLNNLDILLDAYRRGGLPVSLVPPPGQGGPHVVDLGDHLRLLLLDTAWWLMDATDEGRAAFLQRVAEAFRTAGDREVVYSAHHPYQSAGSHGGYVSILDALGVRYALARSGALLQDLNSRPYRDLQDGIRAIGLEHGAALLFAGGHDHSLQVIRDPRDGSPRYSVVAGSASKLTPVGHTPGMLMRRAWPGYVRLFVRHDGGVVLSVVGAPPEHLACPPEEEERVPCMREGADAFRPLWTDRIR